MSDIYEIIEKHRSGAMTDEELAKRIHAHSNSISFQSIINIFSEQFPDARLSWHERELSVETCAPTQLALDNEKYALVCELFDSEENFYKANLLYFPRHPISVLWMRGLEYVIMDGHHRIRRFFELTRGNAEIRVTVISSSSVDLLDNYQRQVNNVAEITGSRHIKDLPIA